MSTDCSYGFDPAATPLAREAQTLTDLGAYEDAAQRYAQMMTTFPADPRGSMGVVRLAIEHGTPLSAGESRLNPLTAALKLGDRAFLSWLYDNFHRRKPVIRAGVEYARNLSSRDADWEFMRRLNRYFEQICLAIRAGEASIERDLAGLFGNSHADSRWDRSSGTLRLISDVLPSVAQLLKEAQEQAAFYRSCLRKVGPELYRDYATPVISRLWRPVKKTSPDYDQSRAVGNLLQYRDGGGLIGNIYFCESDDYFERPEYYYLKQTITMGEIDLLFREMVRCKEQGFCPHCGIGHKSLIIKKCSHCGQKLL